MQVANNSSDFRVSRPRSLEGYVPYLLLSMTVLAVFLVVLPIMGITFISDDDLFAAVARYHSDNPGVIQQAWSFTKFHGRFYGIFVYTLYQLPFLLRSRAFTDAMRLSGTLVSFLAYFFFLREWLKDITVATGLTLLAAVLVNTEGRYYGFHSYALWYHLGISLTFLSGICFIRSLAARSSAGAQGYLVSSVFLYFLTGLFYEAYLLYLPLYVILAYSSLQTEPSGWATRLRLAFRQTVPFAVAMFVYLIILFGFRHFFPSHYPNNRLSIGTISDMIRTVTRFSLATFDHDFTFRYGKLFPEVPAEPFELARAAAIGSLTFLISLACVQGFARYFGPRRAGFAVLLGVILSIIPSLPFALIEGYRKYVAAGELEIYHSSYFATFSWAFAIAGLAALVLDRVRPVRIRPALAFLLSGALAVAAYTNARHSGRFYALHHVNEKRWELVDRFLGVVKNSPFNAVQEPDAFIAPTLWDTPGIWIPEIYRYWSLYFSGHLHHDVEVVRTLDSYLSFSHEEKSKKPWFIVMRYDPMLRAGFLAYGSLDAVFNGRAHPRYFTRNPSFIYMGDRNDAKLSGLSVRGCKGVSARGFIFCTSAPAASEDVLVDLRESATFRDENGLIDMESLRLI